MLASKQLRQVMRPNGDDERSSSNNQVWRERPKQQKEKDSENNLVALSKEDSQSKTSKGVVVSRKRNSCASPLSRARGNWPKVCLHKDYEIKIIKSPWSLEWRSQTCAGQSSGTVALWNRHPNRAFRSPFWTRNTGTASSENFGGSFLQLSQRA